MPDPQGRDKTGGMGVIAEFANPEDASAAARRLRADGFTSLEAYGPFPSEELADAIGFNEHRVAPCVLAGSIVGALFGFGLQYYVTIVDYPHNIGGRPLFSWPSFIPVTFECTILFGAVTGILTLLVLNRLPRLSHPVFSVKNFHRATTDHFFLSVDAGPGGLSGARAREILDSIKPSPLSVSTLEPEEPL